MNPIVTLGSLNMDLVVKTARAPMAGETVPGQDFFTIPGGKGANQAAAVAKLGWPVAMIGRVGADVFGERLRQNLIGLNVDCSRVVTDSEAPTGTATIVVEGSGENRIIIVAGANGRVSRADVDAAASLISTASLVILQFEIPLVTVEYAMELANRHRIPVMLNPAPAYSVADAFLTRANFLVLNETEAGILCGLEVTDLPSAQRASHILIGRGVPVVVLTLGAQGALLATAEEGMHLPAFPVSAVDTTAAGDAFVGALAVSYVRGLALRECVRVANAAGALAVTRLGAQPSLPTAEEIQDLLLANPA